MVKLFLVTFILLLVLVFLMAIGWLISKKEIKGSCGGISALLGGDCAFCGKKDNCPERQR